jgi:hypothetical protein
VPKPALRRRYAYIVVGVQVKNLFRRHIAVSDYFELDSIPLLQKTGIFGKLWCITEVKTQLFVFPVGDVGLRIPLTADRVYVSLLRRNCVPASAG